MIGKTSLVAFLAVAFLATAIALKTGAPKGTCGTMTPDHGVPAKKTDAPYVVSVDKKTVRAGERVTVTIKGKSAQDKIKGFMIQAHGSKGRVGHFVVDSKDTKVQGLACDETKDRRGRVTQIHSAVTHRNNDEKDVITATWVAPKGVNDVVTFHNTIVKDGGTFWVDVKSEEVKINQ